MSNVVNNHKYKNQQNSIQRGHQSLNQRGSAPSVVENHRISYSNAARQGIPAQAHQSHEGVIPKPHPTQNVQQVVITQQPNMTSQVSNVNPGGAQMANQAVANTGTNQMQVMPQTVLQTQGPRFGQAFHQPHHQPRPQQQRALLPNQRTHNPVPQNAVPQNVHQGVPQNMGHQTHQHYFMPTNLPTQIQFPNQLFNAHNMTHATYSHQTRPMQTQTAYYPVFATQQQTYAAPQTYPAYVYQHNPYQTHQQPTAQMMPSQMHTARGAPVSSQAVIQTAQPQIMQIPSNAPTTTEVAEPTPVPAKQIQKRTRTVAIISDPNTGQEVNIEELANSRKEEPKAKTAISRNNESYSGASNQPSAVSTSSPNTSSSDVNSIGLEFATKVAVAATEPMPTRFTASPNISESDVSVDSNLNSRPEAEESVAISNTPLNELSETNDKISDKNICDNSSDDNNLVINTISTISAPNSGSTTDSKLLNENSAQNTNTINLSQNDREINSSEEINENGDITDSCNESVEEKEETTPIEHSTQQKINNNIINNNNRKKDMILKEDNNSKSEELVDNKIDNNSEVTDNSVTVVDKLETQLSSDRSSPVISSTLPTESVDKSAKNIILNNLSENHSEKNDNENNRINELMNNEVCGEPDTSESAISSAKTILPDLPYKDDQWTPLNPDGKKHYDRNFLLAVREKSENSLKMPESLTIGKNQEIIRKDSSSGQHYENPTLFLPDFASRGPDFRNRLMPSNVGRRQSANQPTRGHQDNKRKIISTSLTQEVKLHSADNAWKPSKLAPSQDDPEKETQELLKKIRGILNKLTPQKYEDLVKKIMSFAIDTEDKLRRVLDLVFEKAVDEPAFCLQYANLCKQLSIGVKVTVKLDDNNVEEVKFHKLLIQKCQKEFETEIYASITDLKERQEEIENTSDPQKRKMLKEILDEDMRRARKRSLGNIKLIGELYKLKMLKANIMVQCIEGLIRDGDDESLECLCALFKTIGEQIETEAAIAAKEGNNNKQQQILQSFFIKMDKIAEGRDPEVKGTSARVRFMLRDIIDMRNNGWKARRDENLPKMIDEIHMEAQKEDEQSARDLHQHTLNKKQEERERKQKGRNDSDISQQWTTVSARKSQTNASQPKIDWQMLQSQQQQNHETVQLGPQSGGGTWSLGSRGGAQQPIQQRFQSNEEKGVNRFTALDSDRKSSKSIPSRDSSKGRNQSHGYQSGRGGRSQRGTDREEVVNLVRSFSNQRQSPSESSPMYPNMMSRNSSRGGSREASAPNSRNSSMRRETPDIELSQLKGNYTEEELKRRTKESIKEYLNVKNITIPVLDVTQICNESNAHIYVSTAVECAFDASMSSQSQCFAIGKLLDHLMAKNLIKMNDHFFKGLSSILEFADDLIIDIPKMWDYTADVLSPIFINLTQNRKKFILDLIKMCNEDKRSLFVAKIFVSVSNLTSTEKANELWFNSDLNWNEFLGSDQNVDEFVRKNAVEFTLNKLSNKSTNNNNNNNSDQNYQSFKTEIEALVRQKKTNDEIQNYISKHFNTTQTNDHKFTSALFTAAINGCICAPTDATKDQFSLTFEKNTLQTVCPLLSKFLGGDAEKELQALIALQELMDDLQHPSSLLYRLFQVFYDSGVISQDAFLQWEKSENSRPGKAVAVKSVTSFLTWLQENEEDEDDNDNS